MGYWNPKMHLGRDIFLRKGGRGEVLDISNPCQPTETITQHYRVKKVGILDGGEKIGRTKQLIPTRRRLRFCSSLQNSTARDTSRLFLAHLPERKTSPSAHNWAMGINQNRVPAQPTRPREASRESRTKALNPTHSGTPPVPLDDLRRKRGESPRRRAGPRTLLARSPKSLPPPPPPSPPPEGYSLPD